MNKQQRNRKPKQANITSDKHGEHCFVVNLEYEDDARTYKVKLKPSVERCDFQVTGVIQTLGQKTPGIEYLIGIHAKRELMAWFQRKLDPEVNYVKVQSQEKAEIAFAWTALKYESETGFQLTDLGTLSFEDLHTLSSIIKIINDDVRDAKLEKRNHGHDPGADHFQTSKRNAIALVRKKVPMSDKKRDFFSSVLSRHYGWKDGRIPDHIYEESKKFLAILKLAWKASSPS